MGLGGQRSQAIRARQRFPSGLIGLPLSTLKIWSSSHLWAWVSNLCLMRETKSWVSFHLKFSCLICGPNSLTDSPVNMIDNYLLWRALKDTSKLQKLVLSLSPSSNIRFPNFHSIKVGDSSLAKVVGEGAQDGHWDLETQVSPASSSSAQMLWVAEGQVSHCKLVLEDWTVTNWGPYKKNRAGHD